MSLARSPLRYLGVVAKNPPDTIRAERDPTGADKSFRFNTIWINTVSNDVWELTSASGGSANWTLLGTTSSGIEDVPHGGTGVATLTNHGVVIGQGTSPVHVTTAGTLGQPLVSGGASADPAFAVLGVVGGGTGLATLTASALYVGNGTSPPTALAVGATGQTLMGATAANPGWTGSPSFSGSVTAGAGAVTATNGNFVGSTAGTGFQFNANTATGAAASPVVLNSRAGQVIFTSVSIAAAADLTLTITNSAISASTTQVIYSMSGATTGSAPSIKSVVNSSGSSVIVLTNGTGATTTTADIVMNFLVVN